MFVATKLAKIKRASLFVASPTSYARAAVAAIGYEVSSVNDKNWILRIKLKPSLQSTVLWLFTLLSLCCTHSLYPTQTQTLSLSLFHTRIYSPPHYNLFQSPLLTHAFSQTLKLSLQALVSPYWSHAFQIWLLTALPEWVITRVTLSMHMGIRSAGTVRTCIGSYSTSSKFWILDCISLSLSHTHSRSLTLSNTQILSQTHSLSLSLSLTLTHTRTISHSLSHTHRTHTHTLSLYA